MNAPVGGNGCSPPPRRPRVLYVTTVFGHPARGGPHLRTASVLAAIGRLAEVNLLLLAQPELADEAAARKHFESFCRHVEWPSGASAPRGSAGTASRRDAVKNRIKRLLPEPLRRALGAFRAPFEQLLVGRRQRSLVARRAAELDVDVIWVAYGNILYHLANLRRSTGRAVVIDTDSVWSRFLLRGYPFRQGRLAGAGILLRGWLKYREERRGTARADVTTAVSVVDLAYYRGFTTRPERVLLVPNAIDPDLYQPRTAEPAATSPVLLLSGTMSTLSNEDAARWLVGDILPLVHAHRADARVVLAGREPGPGVLALAGPSVQVTGTIADIRPELNRAAVAVVPLRFESGTRFKILEAFACGTPVVSTTLGAEGLDVRDGQHLLLADTPEAFAGAVLRVLGDAALRRRLAREGLDLVRREYGTEALERQVRLVLETLGLHPHRPPPPPEVLGFSHDTQEVTRR